MLVFYSKYKKIDKSFLVGYASSKILRVSFSILLRIFQKSFKTTTIIFNEQYIQFLPNLNMRAIFIDKKGGVQSNQQ